MNSTPTPTPNLDLVCRCGHAWNAALEGWPHTVRWTFACPACARRQTIAVAAEDLPKVELARRAEERERRDPS